MIGMAMNLIISAQAITKNKKSSMTAAFKVLFNISSHQLNIKIHQLYKLLNACFNIFF